MRLTVRDSLTNETSTAMSRLEVISLMKIHTRPLFHRRVTTPKMLLKSTLLVKGGRNRYANLAVIRGFELLCSATPSNYLLVSTIHIYSYVSNGLEWRSFNLCNCCLPHEVQISRLWNFYELSYLQQPWNLKTFSIVG